MDVKMTQCHYLFTGASKTDRAQAIPRFSERSLLGLYSNVVPRVDALVVLDINSATTRHQSGDFCPGSLLQFSADPIIERLIFARSASRYEEKFDVAFFGCGDHSICLMGWINI
jgi:hypothetical protein